MKNDQLNSLLIFIGLIIGIFTLPWLIPALGLATIFGNVIAYAVLIIPIVFIIFYAYSAFKYLESEKALKLVIICLIAAGVTYYIEHVMILVAMYVIPIAMKEYIRYNRGSLN